jgi:hypothetical protein
MPVRMRTWKADPEHIEGGIVNENCSDVHICRGANALLLTIALDSFCRDGWALSAVDVGLSPSMRLSHASTPVSCCSARNRAGQSAAPTYVAPPPRQVSKVAFDNSSGK